MEKDVYPGFYQDSENMILLIHVHGIRPFFS